MAVAHHRSGSPSAATAIRDPSRRIHPAAGVIAKGSFACEARCFCPCGEVVWVAERCGHIGIRCSRTGDLKDTIIPNSSANTFGSAMIQTGNSDELWMGTTDGRIVVFNTVSKDQIAELRNFEAEKSGEVTGFALEGSFLFASYSSGRVVRWNTRTKEMMGTMTHAAAITSIVLYGGVCYTGDVTGCITATDIKSGERLAVNDDYKSAVSALLIEPTEKVLWAAHDDGKISILTLVHPYLALVGRRVADCSTKITTMVTIGGKVWAGGIDRTTYVWQAANRLLLAKFRDHHAFIFQIAKLYTMETARLWSLSNDKTIQMYDAEGFFFPVHSSAAANEELFAAHATIQSLRVEISILEKKFHLETDKVISRDTELEKCRDEINKLLLKTAALQHAVDLKEETIHGTQADQNKLQNDYAQLNCKVSEMTIAVTNAEHEKSVLRGEIARTEEVLTRVRTQLAEKTSQAAIFEAERNAVAADKQRLQQEVANRDTALANAATEARMLKDEIVSKNVDLARKDRDLENAKARVLELEQQNAKIEEARRQSEEARRRLDDTVIVRDAQLRDLEAHLKNLQQTYGQKETDFYALANTRSAEQNEASRLQDTFMLKSHQFDLLRNERENLDKQLQHERQQVTEARGNENRLRVQNEELRRQLEHEKNNVKLLEDQYTIFQFVINSRGELVNSIWGLHGKLQSAIKALKGLDQGVKSIDPTKDRMTLKREWKTSVVDRTVGSVQSVDEVQKQVDYIIANYLSEYEKLHLGISTAKFLPDAKRPAIVGDQLLTKLRDVSLMKQVSNPQKPSAASYLPPPMSSSLGPQHIMTTTTTRPSSAPTANYYGSASGVNMSAVAGGDYSALPAMGSWAPAAVSAPAGGNAPANNATTLLSSFQSTDLSALSNAANALPAASAPAYQSGYQAMPPAASALATVPSNTATSTMAAASSAAKPPPAPSVASTTTSAAGYATTYSWQPSPAQTATTAGTYPSYTTVGASQASAPQPSAYSAGYAAMAPPTPQPSQLNSTAATGGMGQWSSAAPGSLSSTVPAPVGYSAAAMHPALGSAIATSVSATSQPPTAAAPQQSQGQQQQPSAYSSSSSAPLAPSSAYSGYASSAAATVSVAPLPATSVAPLGPLTAPQTQYGVRAL